MQVRTSSAAFYSRHETALSTWLTFPFKEPIEMVLVILAFPAAWFHFSLPARAQTAETKAGLGLSAGTTRLWNSAGIGTSSEAIRELAIVAEIGTKKTSSSFGCFTGVGCKKKCCLIGKTERESEREKIRGNTVERCTEGEKFQVKRVRDSFLSTLSYSDVC